MFNKYLPYFIFKRLFGDRKQFGSKIDYNDKEFLLYLENIEKFYNDSQKGSIGKIPL